jgi:ATP-binding cassette subfamily B protein
MLRYTWLRLESHFDRPRRDLITLGSLSAIAGISEAATLALVVMAALVVVQDGVGASEKVDVAGWDLTVASSLWVALTMALVTFSLHFLLAIHSAATSSKLLERLRREVLESFGHSSWSRQSAEREGALQDAVSTLALQSSLLSAHVGNAMMAFMSLAALLGVAGVVDPLSTAVVLACGALISIALRPMAKLTRQRAASFVAGNARYVESVARLASLSLEMRAFGVQPKAIASLAGASTESARDYRRSRFITRFGSTLYRDVASVLLVGAVWALSGLDSSSASAIGTVVILVVRALASAQALQVALQGMSELVPNLDALERRIEELAEHRDDYGAESLDAVASISLIGVGYRYPGATTDALREIDLDVPQGCMLGVIGPSGGGKSTLIQLVLRLREPTSGKLLINGLDYARLDEASWRRQVALVPQEPRLMEGTIFDNVRFLRDCISDEHVRAACALAHIAPEIESLPDGYQTVLGPAGSGLSGGQKQRLAIARALVGRPSLLVLDEPTSALDGRSEQLLQETIDGLRGHVTMVVVAHRLSTLRACDAIVAVADGRIVRHLSASDLAEADHYGDLISSTDPARPATP